MKSGAIAYIEEDDCYRFPLFKNLPSKTFSENEIDIMVEILKSHPYPIHQAIYKLEIPEIDLIIKKLFKSGISPKLQDKRGDTVLHKAVMDDVDEHMKHVIAELLKHGVNLEITNIEHNTPLHVALKNNQTELEKAELVKELLKQGSDPNSADGVGNTLLHTASLNGYISITKILLEYGANVNLLNVNQEAPLHMTIGENKIGDVELVIKELLKYGANINNQNNYGETILHDTASEQNIPEYLFQEFLKQGADPNVKNLNGETPLHIAVDFERKTNVKNLLKYGTDLNIRDNNGYSSFETALTCEQKGIFRMLVFNHQSQ